jgi:hypothetical protein
MLPSIKQNAQRAFCYHNADKRQEAEQAIIVLAFEIHRNLALNGRLKDSYPAPISRYAIGKYREGRTGGAPANSTDVTSEHCQFLGRSKVKHYGLAENITDTFQSEASATDARYPVHRAIQFKIDFHETWLQQQTPKDQAIIKELAIGSTQSETARKFGVTPACINQYQKRYAKSWSDFIKDRKKVA